MRLLEYDHEGEFRLTDSFGNETPQYAILSHTWEAEEVTFKDLVDGTSKGKATYRKIQFCGEQARRDGLQYFWVDTCCIDKSNSAELAEAINSMFRWYRNATKCYVYLSDVSIRKRKASDRFSDCTWESALLESRWFTRGWTLQELLAPRSVEFFSQEGERLGDKKTLERQIHEKTGIAVTALRGTSLSQFGVDERLSWAANRQTMREEDEAYSLLGVFNVYMSLIYGEGRDNAFIRLRNKIDKPVKLDRLPYAAEAPFNSYAKQHSASCLPETRVELLEKIYSWVDKHDERHIFWLNGLAGTGKSTIARTVALKYSGQNRLGASFFFSRGGGDVSHAGKFFTSIAIQLANNVPSLQRHICDAVAKRKDIGRQSLRDQWSQLVLRPLSKLTGNGNESSYVLIVDALDECEDDNNVRIILQLLAEARTLKAIQLRIFLTSRRETPIRHGMYRIPQTEHQDFVLQDIPPEIIDHDIYIYVQNNLEELRQEWTLEDGWPGEQVLQQLVLRASGLFIWAATACRFIREGNRRFAPKRLDAILKDSISNVTAPEKHLDDIYSTVLKHSISSKYIEEEQEEISKMLRHILGSIVVLLSPLSSCSLCSLLRLQEGDVDQTLEEFHAILHIPEDSSRPLRPHHPSFRDFLLNNDRCKNPKFWVDEKKAHRKLADRCIQLMSAYLKQDIYSLNTPGILASEVESSRVERILLPEVQYACLYWIQHFHKSSAQLFDNDVVHQFLQVHLLHWLEALSWMGKTSEGILAIFSLEVQIRVDISPTLYAFVHDAKRFALHYRSIIEQAPLQLYYSALVFAPEKCVVRKQFKKCIPHWIQTKLQLDTNWNAVLQTLEGHSGWVRSVAFSPDGKRVASGSADKTVRLWDAVTGTALQTIEGHSNRVTSVAFSPDGKQVVSGSIDKTVRLWDAVTGAALQTLEGHSDWVNSVAFSPDGKRVVSGSADKTVLLWDAVRGAVLQTLEGHSNWVNSVAFSPDGKWVVSGSAEMVRLWDAVTGVALQTLEGQSDWVTSVAFSPDGKQVVSGSDDKTVRLWDAVTGAALQTLEGHSNWVTSVAFSPGGKQVVSSSNDKTVRLWDAVTGEVLQTLEGHSSWITSVAFSPDGKRVVSGSDDNMARLWDANTARLWGSVTREVLQSFEGHSGRVTSVAFSPDGKQVVSGSADNTVRLWDAVKGTALRTLEGHSDWVNSVAFSPDGKQVVSCSDDYTVRLWDFVTGEALQTLEGHSGRVTSVAFSPDGKQVVSGSIDKTVRLWDAVTGAALQTLEGHSGRANSAAFLPDYRVEWGLFVSNDWVAEGKKRILWLPPEYRATCQAVWNDNIVLGHSSGKISLLRFTER